MKNLVPVVSALLSISVLSGCAHRGTVSSVQATNIYSDNDSKIKSKVKYSIDDTSLSKLRKDDAVQGMQCAAHKFPVDAEDAFVSSLPSMLDSIFENVVKAEAARSSDTELSLLFRVERFEPRVKFNPKFFSSDAEATVELSISVTGSKNGSRVFGTTVDSQRNRSGDGGGFCEGGGAVLADATRDVIKDVLEKAGERLASSQTLRK